MNTVNVYEINGLKTNIFPLEVSRDWMNQNKDGYHCPPVTLTNKLGYGISFDQDISFVWNGSSAQGEDGDIEVLEGKDYCFFGRGGGVIGFVTNLVFKTSPDSSLLVMPVPNQFIDGAQCFTTILSSSFYTGNLHVVWRVTSPGKIIKIPAGTPIASVLPISVSNLNNAKIILSDESIDRVHDSNYIDAMFEYGRINKRLTHWYKNALDHLGNKIGKHEADSLSFTIERKQNESNKF
jgi:hypothetical protein